MKLRMWMLGGVAILSASCRHLPAAALPDGCYYADRVPVFKITGHEGLVTIPGDVRKFRVEPGDAEHVVFVPGFLLDGVAPELINHSANIDRQSVRVKPGAVPTVVINWAAYGESEVRRGKPC